MPTIVALADLSLPPDARSPAERDYVAGRVVRKLNLMPIFVVGPVLVLTVSFGLWARLRHGRSLARLDEGRSRALVASWRSARLGLLRDLIAVHERLASLIHFEHRQTGDGPVPR